jgi:hypothetical protein
LARTPVAASAPIVGRRRQRSLANRLGRLAMGGLAVLVALVFFLGSFL